MICEAFIIVWNESETLHLTIEHYQKFCDKITIYDNFSTDHSRHIAEHYGCTVKLFGKEGVLDDAEYIKVKNNCYRDSKAKWVIVCDADEIIWHPHLDIALEKAEGTIFNTQGWEVYDYEMPSKSFLELQRGIPNDAYSKKAIFCPKISINYVYGCHVANPTGPVKECDGYLNLFHYRNIGGPERLVERHELYRQRMSLNNKRWELGVHYLQSDEQRIKEWKEKYDRSIPFYLYDPQGLSEAPFQ